MLSWLRNPRSGHQVQLRQVILHHPIYCPIWAQNLYHSNWKNSVAYKTFPEEKFETLEYEFQPKSFHVRSFKVVSPSHYQIVSGMDRNSTTFIPSIFSEQGITRDFKFLIDYVLFSPSRSQSQYMCTVVSLRTGLVSYPFSDGDSACCGGGF